MSKSPSKDHLHRKIFASQLSSLMKELNINQVDLAGSTGIAQTKISRYLRGVNEPKLADLAALCLFFKVSPAFFLDSTAPVALEGNPQIWTPEEKYLRDLVNSISGKLGRLKPRGRQAYVKAWAKFARAITGE